MEPLLSFNYKGLLWKNASFLHHKIGSFTVTFFDIFLANAFLSTKSEIWVAWGDLNGALASGRKSF
jgi:hypothetical protein